jgi:thiamine transport system substrate-binding protein
MRCSNGVRFTAEIIPVNLIQIMLAEEFEAWRAFFVPSSAGTLIDNRSAADEDLLLIATSLLSAQAFAADTLTVYTGSFAAGGDPVQDQAGLRRSAAAPSNWCPGDGVAILNRLRLEGKHSKADLVLGLDDALVSEAKQSGLFAPCSKLDGSRCRAAGRTILSSPTTTATSPSSTTRASSEPAQEPERAGGRPDLKVIYQDPRTSTPGQG